MNAKELRHTRGYRGPKCKRALRTPISQVTVETAGRAVVLRSSLRAARGTTCVDIEIAWADFIALADAMVAADPVIARHVFSSALDRRPSDRAARRLPGNGEHGEKRFP